MKRLLAAVAAILMIININIPILAADSNRFPFVQRTVRVGISPFPHFSEIAEDGSYSGIIIDYINEIEKYTGWNVEYIFNNPASTVEMLDTGKIDLMGAMNKNPQTIELYNFAELNSGFAYSTITAKKTHTEYIPDDYDTFKGITVAVYNKATSRVEAFKQFCSANNLEVTPVYFDDPAEWEKAFATGEVDAKLTSSAKLHDDEKIIASFKQELYYFGVAKGNTAILRELNHALKQINQISPHFDENLYIKYFGERNYDNFILTSDEKNFINEHPILRITGTPNCQPLGYFDKNGSFKGISADIMEIISKKTGFKLEYVPSEDFKQALSMLQRNQVDMLVGVTRDGLGMDSTALEFSLPYLPLQTVILHRNDNPIQNSAAFTVATVYGFEYEILNNCKKQYYSTTDEAIKAVQTGKADFMAISNLAAEKYMINNGKRSLTIVPISKIDAKLSIALNNPCNPILISILDKAINSINETQKQTIVFQNTSMQNAVTFHSFIYTFPIQTIIAIVLISLLLLLLIFLIMNMRLRLSRKSSLISDTYRIIGELSDEYIFGYDFETKNLSLPKRFAKHVNTNPLINRENCHEEGICLLISAFEKINDEQSFSLEFTCPLADGDKEMFRAICVIIKDNIGKPIRGIGKIVSIQSEFDEKKQLEKMLNTDPLTGLYSKHYCEQWVETHIVDGRFVNHGALLLIDIDNFKDANDTLGHLGGDEALKHFAEIFKSVFHDEEVIGRWGGDEFIVFIGNAVDKADVEKKAQQLCNSINHRFSYNDALFNLSVSIGIALTDGATNFREVFQAADNALYQIKRDKKNGYKFAEI